MELNLGTIALILFIGTTIISFTALAWDERRGDTPAMPAGMPKLA